MTESKIIEEIFKFYDSGLLRGKTVKMTYNGKTHMVFDFFSGEVKGFSRTIFSPEKPPCRDNNRDATGFLADYLFTLLQAIKANSFLDKNLFAP